MKISVELFNGDQNFELFYTEGTIEQIRSIVHQCQKSCDKIMLTRSEDQLLVLDFTHEYCLMGDTWYKDMLLLMASDDSPLSGIIEELDIDNIVTDPAVRGNVYTLYPQLEELLEELIMYTEEINELKCNDEIPEDIEPLKIIDVRHPVYIDIEDRVEKLSLFKTRLIDKFEIDLNIVMK